MALDSLATVDELEGRLGRDFTGEEHSRAELLLADASAAVRAYCGQQFSAGTSTVRLGVRNRVVRLPQRPVVDVTTIEDTDGNDVTFTWFFGEMVEVDGTAGWVDVTYEHGYDDVPGDIVAVVCQIAGRAFGATAADAAIARERIGTYEIQLGPAAAAGGVGMLNDEKAVLNRYRRVGGTAWVEMQ